MKEPYLPTWATIDEAGAWLEWKTGESWPLARLIQAGAMPSAWFEPDPAWPADSEVMIRGFDGRPEGFLAPLIFAADTHRLLIERSGTVMSMTVNPRGDLLRLTPPPAVALDALRFSADALRALVQPAASTGGEPRQDGWKMLVQAEAAHEWKRLRAMGCNPTRASILPHLVRWCVAQGIKTSTKINPTDGYLRTHVLSGKHWSPPDD